ncbi:unnamed protein product [Blepharisma stoltei]|uniref:Uncharacterized protein n=1 Tax=Blepharisma stoltei TaxID=1481888 RepID=A0AAU9JGG3_9CILI|nr:unnamed protein product [Blepharisma stoltei]
MRRSSSPRTPKENLPKSPQKVHLLPSFSQPVIVGLSPVYERLSTTRRQEKKIPKEEKETEYNILCINCQNLVNVNIIEEHSLVCTRVSENVLEVESGSFLTQTNFKLQKLEKCLSDIATTPGLRPGDKNYIAILSRLCSKISNLIPPAFKDNTEVLNSLSSLLVTFRGSLSIRIYADRLQSLAQDQKIAIQEYEIEQKKQEVDKLRTDVEKYKSRATILQRTLLKHPGIKETEINRKLEEISSEISSFRSGNTSAVSSSTFDEDTTKVEEYEENIPERSSSADNLQRFFYSICLGIKMKSATNSQIQNIDIQKLYNEVQKNNVPIENWNAWVIQALKNPERWIERKIKGNRRRQPRSSFLKEQYFETIVEEEA